MRAAPDRDPIGIAGDQPDTVEGHAEELGHQLSETGFVTLALGCGAENDLDDAFR